MTLLRDLFSRPAAMLLCLAIALPTAVSAQQGQAQDQTQGQVDHGTDESTATTSTADEDRRDPLLRALTRDEEETPERVILPPTTLQQMARDSDVVAVVQVNITDYQRRRDIPVRGTAYLNPLITYKTPQPLDRITVFEEGLWENECYFPDEIGQEGARFLVFLNRDPEQFRFLGHRAQCKLPILVTRGGHYALRWPLDRVAASEELEAVVQEMDFVGPGARVNRADMDYREIDRLEALDAARMEGRTLIYTKGIPLSEARRVFAQGIEDEDD